MGCGRARQRAEVPGILYDAFLYADRDGALGLTAGAGLFPRLQFAPEIYGEMISFTDARYKDTAYTRR